MDITEINDGPLSTILADYQICRICKVVDQDQDRCNPGHPCGTCGNPSDSGLSYFNTSVMGLINLIQEFYHLRPVLDNEYWIERRAKERNPQKAVIFFYVALREILLTDLLDELMVAKGLPKEVSERIFNDNNSHMQRLNNVFPALTGGVKWKQVLTELDGAGSTYSDLNNFLKYVVGSRNTFLHEGDKYEITDEMAKDCLINVKPLLSLHVDLHNRFVHPIFFP